MTAKLSIQTRIKLNSGHEIPQLGQASFKLFGVYQSPPDVTTRSVTAALEAGYLHVDSAQMYKNEAEAAQAILNNKNLKRSDVFFTTKLNYQSKDSTTVEKMYELLEESVAKTNLDGYVDLFIIHAPLAGPANRKAQWQALEQLKAAGKTKSIGISNYGVKHMQELLEYAKEPISVNQIEVHPWLQQGEIVDFAQKHGIAIEAYCPLVQAEKANDPILNEIAKKHNKTWAQVLIRWSLQKGFIPLPKSDTPSRIAANCDLYDFELASEDMQKLDNLESGHRICWNPTTCD